MVFINIVTAKVVHSVFHRVKHISSIQLSFLSNFLIMEDVINATYCEFVLD